MPLPPSGKPRNASPSAFQKTLLAQAVAVALTTLAVPSTSALAADICNGAPGTTTTITTVQSNTDNCVLGAGESLDVVAPGSITRTAGTAVNVFGGITAGSISNSGTISGGNTGISVFLSSSVGSISNSGTISGGNTGIGVFTNSSVTGNISNSGAISGGIRVIGTSSVSGISNSGTISNSSTGIGVLNSSTVGSISNSAGGTISGNTGIGVLSSSTVGSISNSGVISGGIGINVLSSTVGSISNNGTISGNRGISVVNGTVSGGISNSGIISGGLNSISVSVASIVPSINITGPAAQLIGNVSAPNTPLNINAGARLLSGSNFNVAGFNNSGTFAVPAGATSTITGNYTQLAGGVFESGLTAATTFGRLAVTGTANLSASNAIAVNVVGAPVLTAGTVLSSVISAGTLTAGPTLTITDNSALFDFTGAVVGNAINLTIVAAAAAAAAAGGGTVVAAVTGSGMTSGLGAAAVFDSLIALGAGAPAGFAPVITALGTLPNDPAVATAALQTVPFSDIITQSTLANLRGIKQTVLVRSEAGGATNKQGLASGDGFASNRGAWVKPLGSWADQKDRSGAFGYDARTYGIVVGADGDLSKDYRLGAAFAYTRSNVDGNSGFQTADVDSYGVTLYGTHNLNPGTELNWQADYAHHQNESNRRIAFVNQTAASDYNSNSIHLGIGVAHSMVTGVFGPKTIFTPSLRADYTRIRDGGYTETGAGALNLVVNGRSTDELILALDGKLSHALNETATLNTNLGVGYDTQAKQSSVTAAFQGGGAAFATTGINPSKTLVRGGLGLVVNTTRAMEITARYDVEARKDFTNQTASIRFKMPF